MKEYNFKMYLFIVLLLLFETHFTYSMKRQRTQQVENGMVPFDTAYTNSVQIFIRDVVFGASHYFTIFPILLSRIGNKITGHQIHDKCDIEPDPLKPGKFRATQSSSNWCEIKCAKLNFQYVHYLEECISLAKAQIFQNEASSYEVKLNPIQKNIGTCVDSEPKVFVCDCTINYRILMSESLKNAVENAVSMHNGFPYTRDGKRDFFTFILLLKYHPRAAPLFLAYSADMNVLKLGKAKIPEIPELDFQSNLNLNTEVLPEGGLIDNKGSILINEDKIFQALLQKMNCKECNLRKFGFKYLNPYLPIAVLLLITFFICVSLNRT